MPLLDKNTFEKYQYGSNQLYSQRYNDLLRSRSSDGICLAAAINFVELAYSGNTIDLNGSYYSFICNAEELNRKQAIYISSHSSMGGDRNYLKEELYRIVRGNISNSYKSDVSSYFSIANNAGNIISGILNEATSYPCGVIAVTDSISHHALAYACDRHYLYLYDPNHGIMRFRRTLETMLNQAFSRYIGLENGCDISFIAQAYCRIPADVTEPSSHIAQSKLFTKNKSGHK
ncbi:hypothetical protein [Cedecea sp.]|jgi:hypothetical protein|uniref:hypothetical protein n=1 Tax=Cedecea sp. TaxID=1970739 RepID=UPI002F4137DF